MGDDADERKYSDADGDDEVREEELSEELKRIEDDLFVEDLDQLESINSAISSASRIVEIQSFRSADLDDLRNSPVRSPLEAYADSGHGEIEAREEKVQEILDENASAPGDAAQERRSNWNASRYLILVGIATATGGAIIYAMVSRAASGQPDGDIPLSDELKARIRSLVASWQGQSDSAFWGSMAAYVRANRCTLADLVYFMQYTMDLNPLTRPFFWDHAADPDILALGLEASYRSEGEGEGGSAALLYALPGLEYRGAGLPRYEQAYVARTAFADLAGARHSRALATKARAPAVLPIVLYVEGGLIDDYIAEHAAARPAGALRPRAPMTPAGGPPPLPKLVPLPIDGYTPAEPPFALLPGETVRAQALMLLAAPWLGLAEGTAVYLVHTDRAVLACPASPVLARIAARQPMRLVATSAEDVSSAILQFSSTASFALPEPFGPLLSGAISAIASFFGGGGDDVAAAFAAAMQELLGEIRLMLAMDEIRDAAAKIEVSVQWLADKTTVVSDLQGQDPHNIERTLRDDLLPSILTFLDPNTGILAALTTLYDFGSSPLSPSPSADVKGAKHWAQLRENAFQTLVSGVGTYLSWLRIRLQWQAALETQQAKDAKPGDPQPGTLVYDYFDQFRIATDAWVTKCSQRLGELYADRTRFVSHSNGVTEFTMPLTGEKMPIGLYFHVRDDWNGKSYDCQCDLTYLYLPAPKLPPVPNSDFPHFMASSFGPAFEADYRSQRAMLQGFADAIADWNKKIAPPKPSNLAVADPDPAKWGADAPQGGKWVSGAHVRYAIDNVNGAGTATRGEWGDAVRIDKRAFALVSQIPIDGLGLTVARHLRRQFTDPDGIVGPEETVAIVANNKDTFWLDTAP